MTEEFKSYTFLTTGIVGWSAGILAIVEILEGDV
jgi:hypothetical protein